MKTLTVKTLAAGMVCAGVLGLSAAAPALAGTVSSPARAKP